MKGHLLEYRYDRKHYFGSNVCRFASDIYKGVYCTTASDTGASAGTVCLRNVCVVVIIIFYNCIDSLHFSLHFNCHFPGVPGLAGTRMSPIWILLELRVMEVVVTTAAIRCAKLQSNHHHQQTNKKLFTGWMPFLSPNQQCQSIAGKTVLTVKVLNI